MREPERPKKRTRGELVVTDVKLPFAALGLVGSETAACAAAPCL
jgi:hypothetical protein